MGGRRAGEGGGANKSRSCDGSKMTGCGSGPGGIVNPGH